MAVPFIVILPGLLGLVVLQNPDGSRRQLSAKMWSPRAPVHRRFAIRTCSARWPKPLCPPTTSRRSSTARPSELHSYNEVLPLMMVRYLGPGLLGLGITALIAGFMSGMAGNVSAFSAVWTYDIYQPLINKNGNDEHYVLVGRWAIVIGVIISIGTAYLVMNATASWITCRRSSASSFRLCWAWCCWACSGSAPPRLAASGAC